MLNGCRAYRNPSGKGFTATAREPRQRADSFSFGACVHLRLLSLGVDYNGFPMLQSFAIKALKRFIIIHFAPHGVHHASYELRIPATPSTNCRQLMLGSYYSYCCPKSSRQLPYGMASSAASRGEFLAGILFCSGIA